MSTRDVVRAVWVTLRHDGDGGEKIPPDRRVDMMCPQTMQARVADQMHKYTLYNLQE